MDSRLAEEAQDFTYSVVFRDDIVPRFSPEALLNLNDQINDFNAEEEIDVRSPNPPAKANKQQTHYMVPPVWLCNQAAEA